jgi:hypothetical protein
MIGYKIQHKNSRLYSDGSTFTAMDYYLDGYGTHWSENGKIWYTRRAVTAHLNSVLRKYNLPDTWEVVEVEISVRNSVPASRLISPETLIKILKRQA